MNRAHTAFATSAGFCFGIAGFILSVLAAIICAVLPTLVPDRSDRLMQPVVIKRRRSMMGHPPSKCNWAIPTITMTQAEDDDDWNSDSAAPPLINTTDPSRYLDETNAKPPRLRSASSPQLTIIPAASFLQLPIPERRGKKRSIRRRNGRHQNQNKEDYNGCKIR